MAAYDAATFDRNRGIRDPSRRVSSGRSMSRREVLSLYPGLPTTGLTGAGVFQDGQLLNPPRLVWAFVRSAGKLGCAACNYVEATGLVVDGGRALAVRARDRVGGGDLTIRGRAVLNAAGPYAESFLKSAGLHLEPPTPWSRDAYFVVARALVPGDGALALLAKTRDPDALVSRGARHLFLAPWRGRTLVGVWHRVHRGEPDAVELAADEVESFLAEINEAYGDLDLDLDDVAMCNAGLIPFGENDPAAKDLKFSHGSRIVDHVRTDGLAGMFTLIGARFTTAPRDTAVAVDRIVRAQRPGSNVRQGSAATQPLVGGEFPSIAELVAEVRGRAPSTLRDQDVEALVQNHGSEYPRVLELVRSEPRLAETFGAFPVLKAEVRYAVREEMALTLADVVFRRTELGTGEYPGRRIIDECAEIVGAELGWSQARRSSEVSAVLGCYPRWIRDRVDRDRIDVPEQSLATGNRAS
jgi:glycerol-3-phosphate dehydrogenase